MKPLCLTFLLYLGMGGLCHAAATDTHGKIPQGNRIVVEKSRRLMHVYNNQEAIVTFRIALGKSPVGQKNCQGDNRTPEGNYTITQHNEHSAYYRSLKISYPSSDDKARARKLGCHPGGEIMIHGLRNGFDWVGRTHRSVDWTNGCIAITNQNMDILYNMVQNGATIEIKP